VNRQIRLAAVFLLAMVVMAPAQQPVSGDAPASKDDVMKLFAVMGNQAQVRTSLGMITKQMATMNREQLKQRNSAVTEEDLARMDQEMEQFARNFPVDKLLDDMVPVYQKHLTKPDVDAMLTFYSSPTGQKLLREMPVIATESMQAVYPRIQREIDAISKRMDEKSSQPTPAEKK
jgi:hypothetical protein